tara:strand:- start:6922 stop:7293 length:372 start_codon:yes stop_codon:yes gene_type:complete
MFKNSDKLLHLVLKELCKFAETNVYKHYPDVLKSLKWLSENTKDMKFEYTELYSLYTWYKNDRPKRKNKNDIGVSMMYYEQDTKMLARAVALRKFSKKLYKGGDYDPAIGSNQATQKSIRQNK